MELRRATELLPNDSASHYALAQVLQKLGKAEESAAELRRAQQQVQGEKAVQLAKGLTFTRLNFLSQPTIGAWARSGL